MAWEIFLPGQFLSLSTMLFVMASTWALPEFTSSQKAFRKVPVMATVSFVGRGGIEHLVELFLFPRQ